MFLGGDPTFSHLEFPGSSTYNESGAQSSLGETHFGGYTPNGIPKPTRGEATLFIILGGIAGGGNLGVNGAQELNTIGGLVRSFGKTKTNEIGGMNRQELSTHNQGELKYLEENNWNPKKIIRGGVNGKINLINYQNRNQVTIRNMTYILKPMKLLAMQYVLFVVNKVNFITPITIMVK